MCRDVKCSLSLSLVGGNLWGRKSKEILYGKGKGKTQVIITEREGKRIARKAFWQDFKHFFSSKAMDGMKWPDKSTKSYVISDFKSYIKNNSTLKYLVIQRHTFAIFKV